MKIDTTRFDRQIALPQLDLAGQEKLQNAHVMIIGLGGLGCAAAQSIVAMGVGKVTLVDFDTIERSNLPRQPLYSDSDVGASKVETAKRQLQQLNPNADIVAVHQAFSAVLATDLHHQHAVDLLLDCTDNSDTRLAINRVAVSQKISLITAAAIRFEGMVFAVTADDFTPCYECLAKVWPAPDESCVERGVFTPIVSIIGHYQAMMAGQWLTGLALPAPGTVQFFDGLAHQWSTLKISTSSVCSVCTDSN